jgi:hypothetical protein
MRWTFGGYASMYASIVVAFFFLSMTVVCTPTTGVSEYHPRASFPFRMLTQGLIYPISVAMDTAGNVYANQRQGNGGFGEFVMVFLPGSSLHFGHQIRVPL